VGTPLPSAPQRARARWFPRDPDTGCRLAPKAAYRRLFADLTGDFRRVSAPPSLTRIRRFERGNQPRRDPLDMQQAQTALSN